MQGWLSFFFAALLFFLCVCVYLYLFDLPLPSLPPPPPLLPPFSQTDFPLKGSPGPNSSEFEDDICEYFKHTIPSTSPASKFKLVQRLSHYNFDSAQCHFIGSVPGRHTDSALRTWGHMKLRTILSREVFAEKAKSSKLALQYSSQGSMKKNDAWLGEICASMSSGGNLGAPKDVQIVWPTVVQVRSSLEGYAAGHCIPGYAKNVMTPSIQQKHHGWVGRALHNRGRAMPHIKSFCRHYKMDDDPRTHLAWFVLGSHNLSMAAWGTLEKGGYGRSQLFIRSYEAGVLFTPRSVARFVRAQVGGAPFRCVGISPTPRQGLDQLPALAGNLPEMVLSHQTSRPSATIEFQFPIPYSLDASARYSGVDYPWICDAAPEVVNPPLDPTHLAQFHLLDSRSKRHPPSHLLYGITQSRLACRGDV
jgi:tyrosyl-DNA phosphodiesterase-1